MRWTDADYRAYLARQGTAEPLAATTPDITLLAQQTPPQYRSKTEARYAEVLRWRQAEKQLSAWWYEPFSLRLGADIFYRPDFMVALHESPLLTLVEVKGAWIRDRAMVKPKAAATRFPCFVFVLATWDRQMWTETRILAHP
jgi:hypothetical protein